MKKLNLSKEQITELQESRKKYWKFQYIRRIECILYRYEWKSNKYICSKLGISDDSISLWIDYYCKWWIEKLLMLNYSSRRKNPLEGQITKIKQYVQVNKIPTLSALWKYIKDQFWYDYTISNLSRLAKKNEIFLWKNRVALLEK